MSAAVWTIGFLLVAAFGATCVLNAKYDQTERRLDQESGCRCPEHDAGGTCAKDGAL